MSVICDFGGPFSFISIALDGVSLSVCFNFRYLCLLLQNDNDIDWDMKNRMHIRWMKWRQATVITCDPMTVVMSLSVCWATKGTDERKVMK